MLTENVSCFLSSCNHHTQHDRILTIPPDVTTLSGSGGTKDSKGSASRSRLGVLSHKGSRASHAARTAWASTNHGKSKAYVESGTGRKDSDKFSDAASDNSERAIVVKTTVDVS
jgi:hypothetical protein